MKKTKKQSEKLEQKIQEFYDDVSSEPDYYIGNYGYHPIMADGSGWDVYIEDMNRKDMETAHWQAVSPHEHFKDRVDLISHFKIKEDGRTVLEYICDECGEERLLVPPLPIIAPDW